jgi:hypothetical protein
LWKRTNGQRYEILAVTLVTLRPVVNSGKDRLQSEISEPDLSLPDIDWKSSNRVCEQTVGNILHTQNYVPQIPICKGSIVQQYSYIYKLKILILLSFSTTVLCFYKHTHGLHEGPAVNAFSGHALSYISLRVPSIPFFMTNGNSVMEETNTGAKLKRMRHCILLAKYYIIQQFPWDIISREINYLFPSSSPELTPPSVYIQGIQYSKKYTYTCSLQQCSHRPTKRKQMSIFEGSNTKHNSRNVWTSDKLHEKCLEGHHQHELVCLHVSAKV